MQMNGKNEYDVIKWVETCWEYANGQKIYVYEKNGLSGLDYIHAYDHNIQTSCSWKLSSQSKPIFMWSIVRKGE